MADPIKKDQKQQQEDDKSPISASKSKPTKKEPKQEPMAEDDDEDDVPLAVTKAKNKKAIKKQEPDSEEEAKPKPKPKKVPLRAKKEEESEEEEMKRRKRKGVTKEVVGKAKKVGDANVKKEKKVYDLPGQKHDPPEEVCYFYKNTPRGLITFFTFYPVVVGVMGGY